MSGTSVRSMAAALRGAIVVSVQANFYYRVSSLMENDSGSLIKTYFTTFLLVDFYMLSLTVVHSIASCHTFIN